MQEARAKYREMILKVVQKILIKTRHVACRRLKFSNLFQKCSRDEPLNLLFKRDKRRKIRPPKYAFYIFKPRAKRQISIFRFGVWYEHIF